MTDPTSRTRNRRERLIRPAVFLGVPLAVIAVTGGPETLGFWGKAVALMIPAYTLGFLLSFPLLLALFPIYRLVCRFSSWINEEVMVRFNLMVWVTIGVVVYTKYFDLGYAEHVRLPTPWTNVGALVVIGAAVSAMAGLLFLGHRLRFDRSAPSVEPITPLWGEASKPENVFRTARFVVGWRSWRWVDGTLHGVWETWPGPEHWARCDRCQRVPGWEHTCGIYALKRRGDADKSDIGFPVLGRVEMWGDVIEHERGYRASHARITDLWVGSARVAEELKMKYSVDIHVLTLKVKGGLGHNRGEAEVRGGTGASQPTEAQGVSDVAVAAARQRASADWVHDYEGDELRRWMKVLPRPMRHVLICRVRNRYTTSCMGHRGVFERGTVVRYRSAVTAE